TTARPAGGRPGAAAGRSDRRAEDDPRLANAGQQADAAVRASYRRRPGRRAGNAASAPPTVGAPVPHPPGHARPPLGKERMTTQRTRQIGLALLALVGIGGSAAALDDPAEQASWQAPSPVAVREQLVEWLSKNVSDPAARETAA